MKNILSLAIALMIAAALIFAVVARHASHQEKSPRALKAMEPASAGYQAPPPGFLTTPEWREIHAARKETLAKDRELVDRYDHILKDISQQQQQFDAAMVKADPSVAPLIQKLQQAQHALPPAASATASLTSAPFTAASLSPEEWAKVQAARGTAIKTDPSLAQQANQVSTELKAYQDDLYAAMIKTDPKVGPLVARLTGNR